MKVFGLLAAGLFVLAGVSFADMPGILPGVKIKDGSSDLKLSSYVNPTVVDWNNDGLTDLLVGEFHQGKIALFLNQGTNLNPVFDGYIYLESSGLPITVGWG